MMHMYSWRLSPKQSKLNKQETEPWKHQETGDMLYLTKTNINSLKRSVAIIF